MAQLDRRTGEQGGGIALYALSGFEQSVAHLADSKIDERSWFIIHADSGPILLCLWYRRPNIGEIESVRRFDEELSLYSRHGISCIIMGDLNCHNPDWLRFSSRNTLEIKCVGGRLLYTWLAATCQRTNARELFVRSCTIRPGFWDTLPRGAWNSRK